jgi:hypothetical protein
MTALVISYTLDQEPTMSWEEHMEWYLHSGGDVWYVD